jgi:hypothetical protein
MKLNKQKLYLVFCLLSFVLIFSLLQFYFDLFTLPYFWDELGVYSRAAIHLYEHGPGILPSALPDELSRGHPTLIPFLFGVVFKVFGCKVVVARLFAAAIYLVGVMYGYRILLLKLSPINAAIFTILIFIQPCFLSQSVLVLPEMPLMVATLMAVFYFLNKNYIGLCCALVLALFVKESAIILPFVIFFIDLLNQRFKLNSFVSIIVIPFALISSFFAVQYFQRGYVFYPLHTGLMKFEWYYIKERWDVFYDFVFIAQGRWLMMLALPILLIVLYAKKIKVAFQNKQLFKAMPVKQTLLLFCLLFFIAGIVFSTLNYILGRYLIFIMVFQYIGCVVYLNGLLRQRVWSYLLMVYLGFTGLWYSQRTGYTDVDFSYVEHIKSCQQAMNYLNVPLNKDTLVAMGFPLNICTWNPQSGYFKERYFQNRDFKDSSDMDAHFYVFTFPGNMHDTMLYKGHLKLHKQVKSGYAYVNIYTRK